MGLLDCLRLPSSVTEVTFLLFVSSCSVGMNALISPFAICTFISLSILPHLGRSRFSQQEDRASYKQIRECSDDDIANIKIKIKIKVDEMNEMNERGKEGTKPRTK
jgi:hypothetical protein